MKRVTMDDAARALSRRREAIYARHGETRSALEIRSEPNADAAIESLPQAEANEVIEIDAALKRIDDGRYGRCERCGGAIGSQRIHALPETRFCFGCSNG